MSLNFPPSPTVGQTYQRWIWGGQAWEPNLDAQFVTSFNGRTGPITLQPSDMPAGSRVLIRKQVVTTPVAVVDFITGIDATYDEYEVSLYDVRVTADSQIAMRVSADGGATWKADAGGYNWGVAFPCINSASGAWAGGTSTYGQLTSLVWAGGNTGAASLLRFNKPSVSGVRKPMLLLGFQNHPTLAQSGWNGHVMWNLDDAPINGLRFFAAVGSNFVAGSTFSLYGFKK